VSRPFAHPVRRPLAAALAAALLAAPAVPVRAAPPSGATAPASTTAAAGTPVRAAPAPFAAPSGFSDWLGRGDATAAAVRFRADAAASPADPWPRLGEAMLAERALDEEAEAAALVAIVEAAPAHPLALVALRRLGELSLAMPPIAARVDEAVGAALAAGRLPGPAAYRARVVRAAVAEMRGDVAAAAVLRRENGIADGWSLAGPFGAYHALDLDRPFPPERGEWPPPGARVLPAPDGVLSLDGEPGPGDVWFVASDVDLARGGRYLLAAGSTASFRVLADGRPVAERRAWAGWPSAVQVVPVELGPGTHRVLVKLTRGSGRAALALSLAREDGTPSDATWKPATRPGPAAVPGALPSPLLPARTFADALAPEAGPVLARLVAARDRMENDRQASLEMLDEAVAVAPEAAPLRSARGEALAGDPTLAERIARGRSEADWREASRLDPGDAASRLVLAELAMAGGRLDDAEALLAALAEKVAGRPRARLARARLLAARSSPEAAESLVIEAARSGSCAGASLLAEMASRRDAIALEDEAVQALARCPGGAERVAEHRRKRGDLAAAEEAWRRMARAAPARIDARTALVRVLLARGDAAGGAAELEDLARTWPSDAPIQRRRAELLELAGDAKGARAARERALAQDGADLVLRRALALEDGTEVLADLAVDGPSTIRDYEAAKVPVTTPASLVLDAAAVEAFPDGTTVERTHQVVHVHDARGVDKWGEVEIPPGATVMKIQTRKRDGRILEPESHGGDKRTISAAGLEPGDYLELEWLRAHPTRRPAAPGWTSDPFFFRGEELPFFLSTYSVAAPAGQLQLDVRAMAPPPVERRGDRDVMRAEAHVAAPLVPEPAAPGISEYVPMVMAGSGEGVDGLALLAADGFAERVRPGREIAALARALRDPPGEKPRTGEALLRAAWQVVMEKVDANGPLTDQASHVLSRGRGSRLLLLVALLDALGIPANVAIVRPFYVDPSPWRFPRLDLYSVPAVRAEVDGTVFWLDPSVRWAPFGALPPGARDAEVLVLPRPGQSLRRERTPATPAPDATEVVLRIRVGADGDAVIEGTERYAGFEGAGAKAAIDPVDETGRRRAFEQALSRSFRSLRLEEIRFEGERQVGTPLVIRYRARVGGLARAADGRLVIDDAPYPTRLGARLAPLASRESPLLIGIGERSTLRIEIEPPPGAVPRPGAPVRLSAPEGSYVREERVEGGRLVREDRLELVRSRVSPAAYPDFARFAAAVDEAQALPLDLGAAE
jgi:cellulose synthase operon protein C